MTKNEIVNSINTISDYTKVRLEDCSIATNQVIMHLPDGSQKRIPLDHTAVAVLKEHGVQLGTKTKKALLGDRLVYVAIFTYGDLDSVVGVRSTYDKIMDLCQEHYKSAIYNDDAPSVRASVVNYDRQEENVMLFKPDEDCMYRVEEVDFE